MVAIVTGVVNIQGVTLGAAENFYVTTGNPVTDTGITINGGTGPAYTYDSSYTAFITSSYSLTAVPYALPWEGAIEGQVGSVYDSNHTYRFDPSWNASVVSAQNPFAFDGTGIGPDAEYFEIVVNDLVCLTTPIVFQVGIETVLVPYAGNVPDPQVFYQVYYTSNGIASIYLNGVLGQMFDLSSAGFTYSQGDVIGMVIYRDGGGIASITWFKNGIFVGTLDINSTMWFERVRVNIGQNVVGYPYGPTPPAPPPVSSSGLIKISGAGKPNTYVYLASYNNDMAGIDLITDTFQTGFPYEVYTDSNTTIADLGL